MTVVRIYHNTEALGGSPVPDKDSSSVEFAWFVEINVDLDADPLDGGALADFCRRAEIGIVRFIRNYLARDGKVRVQAAEGRYAGDFFRFYVVT